MSNTTNELAAPPATASPPAPTIKVVQPRDPRVALGMAVAYLMNDPVFARQPFGQWSRVLVGQVNRGHYLFAMEGEKVVGFVGWMLTTKEKAEAWLVENRDISFGNSREGNTVVVNAWKADDGRINGTMVRAFRHVIRSREWVYAKRFYADGRARPLRLPVNAFVGDHIAGGSR